MAKITSTLSIGITFRSTEDIAEVEKLKSELAATKMTNNEIYLAGLRQLTGMIRKAKDIVK